MLREAENVVRIEGILSEVDLNAHSFTNAKGETVESIRGFVKIRVDQTINSEQVTLEIPISMFASKYSSKGGINPAYTAAERVMNEYKSIAAVGEAAADCVRITNGRVQMNEYYGQNGNLVSFPRIQASFLNLIRRDEMKPSATFSIQFVVAKKGYELDKEGIETNRYKITGIVPKYGDKVDVVEFISTNPKVISAIDQFWNENDTYSAIGRLNFTSTTETILKEVDFGEPQELTRTVSVSELVITGGSEAPLDGEFAYDMADIQVALKARKAALEASKEQAQNKTKTAPKNSGLADLGF